VKKLKLAGLVSALTFLTACDHLTTKNSIAMVVETDPVEAKIVSVETNKYGAWGIDLTTQDSAVKPGDDFYRFANGEWLNEYKLPADKTKFGMLGLLNEEAEENVKQIIIGLSETEHQASTVEQQVGDLYANYMDIESRNKEGLTPIQPILERIQGITTHTEVYEMFAQSDLKRAGSALVIWSTIDRKAPDTKVLGSWADGTGLPDRDYYLVDSPRFEEIRAAYLKHIKTMLSFAGYDAKRAVNAADGIMILETKIAEALPTRADARDATKNYNAFTYEELNEYVPGLDWESFVANSDIDVDYAKQSKWVLRAPQAFKSIVEIINETSVETWRDFMAFNLITAHSGSTTAELELAAFEFQKVISGQQQITERWKRGVGLVSGMFGEAVGEVYVKQYFTENSKAEMQKLIDNLAVALGSRLKQLSWMSDETKVQAMGKLKSFNTDKIGYPNKWEDYSGLDIVKGDLYASLVSARKWARAKRIREMMEPIDRTKWGMTPQTVNAYYNPVFNEIVFPAAILQAPLFDMSADPAVNYGGIGAVIGHEMSHGFDNNGRRYDAQGVLRDWWTDKDSETFNGLAEELIGQFNGYEAAPDVFVNGKFTLGENIGDLGGVMIAFEAYQNFLDGKEAPLLDGLTGEQRFFLAWAQSWREKVREAKTVQQIKSDPHSPGKFRVNGIMRNIDAWYDAFDVKEGDSLYLPPEERVRIW